MRPDRLSTEQSSSFKLEMRRSFGSRNRNRSVASFPPLLGRPLPRSPERSQIHRTCHQHRPPPCRRPHLPATHNPQTSSSAREPLPHLPVSHGPLSSSSSFRTRAKDRHTWRQGQQEEKNSFWPGSRQDLRTPFRFLASRFPLPGLHISPLFFPPVPFKLFVSSLPTAAYQQQQRRHRAAAWTTPPAPPSRAGVGRAAFPCAAHASRLPRSSPATAVPAYPPPRCASARVGGGGEAGCGR